MAVKYQAGACRFGLRDQAAWRAKEQGENMARNYTRISCGGRWYANQPVRTEHGWMACISFWEDIVVPTQNSLEFA